MENKLEVTAIRIFPDEASIAHVDLAYEVEDDNGDICRFLIEAVERDLNKTPAEMASSAILKAGRYVDGFVATLSNAGGIE